MIGIQLSDQQLEQHIIELVNRCKQSYGIVDGDLGRVACEKLGLRLEFGSLPSGQEGLYQEDLGIVIIDRSTKWIPRVEFTIYHEIMHFLLIEEGDLYGYLHDTHGSNEQSFDRLLERCCEMGAAEFLMPRDNVRSLIREKGLSAQLIVEIAKVHGASILASAIQAAVCAPIACYTIVCAHGPIPNSWPPRQGLYIEHVSWPSRNRYPLGRFIQIPSNHLFYDSWVTGQSVSNRTFVPSRKGRKNWACEGQSVKAGSRVVGLLLLEEQIRNHKNQLSLGI